MSIQKLSFQHQILNPKPSPPKLNIHVSITPELLIELVHPAELFTTYNCVFDQMRMTV